MKYCEYCGSEAQNYFSNCHSCGAPFSIKTLYSKDELLEQPSQEQSNLDFALAFELMPILITLGFIGYAVDKIGNLFRFRKKKIADAQPARFVYEKRRGYL